MIAGHDTNQGPAAMKPVLILQHLSGDGPAYLARWLHARGVPVDVRDTQAGQAFPDDLGAHAALAVLGGEMSANDELPSLRQAEQLILEAMAQGKPVIGHCLGGQLMARALGQRVTASPRPEVGWQRLQVLDSATARDWFGPAQEAVVFHWHYEAFERPPQARWLARSDACAQQAFAIGPHLAMQFHIEVDREKVERWSREEGPRWADALRDSPQTVQDGAAMRAGIDQHLAAHQRLADRLYGRWLAGVAGA